MDVIFLIYALTWLSCTQPLHIIVFNPTGRTYMESQKKGDIPISLLKDALLKINLAYLKYWNKKQETSH